MKSYTKLLYKLISVSLSINILSRVTHMPLIIIIPIEQRTVFTVVHAHFWKKFSSINVMYYQFTLILCIIYNKTGLMLIALVTQSHTLVCAAFSPAHKTDEWQSHKDLDIQHSLPLVNLFSKLFYNSLITNSIQRSMVVTNESWTEQDLKGTDMTQSRYYPNICLKWVRKTITILVRLIGVLAEIWTEHQIRV
jgi:hypothetical protein